MDLAAQFNLSVTAYGELLTPAEPAYGTLSLNAAQILDPAPVSPIEAAPFQLLAASIRTARKTAAAQDVIVAPGMVAGNTGASLS